MPELRVMLSDYVLIAVARGNSTHFLGFDSCFLAGFFLSRAWILILQSGGGGGGGAHAKPRMTL